MRGYYIFFPRKRCKNERNWCRRPCCLCRWSLTRHDEITFVLRSGHVEWEWNHTSKQWLHLGNLRNLSPSVTSWRLTTQYKVSLLPRLRWKQVNTAGRWWLCQKFFAQKWIVRKTIAITIVCRQLVVIAAMELAIFTINSNEYSSIPFHLQTFNALSLSL